MRVDYNEALGKFVVSTDVYGSDIENARAIPNRKYDKTSSLWIAGPTKANVGYFCRWGGETLSERAKDACTAIMRGSAIRKWALPEGFCFKTDPRPHQLEPLLRMVGMPEYALLMDPGTGKSKILIDNVHVQNLLKKINGSLTICPNSIKSNWEDEITIHSPGVNSVFVYEPDRKKECLKWINKSEPWGVVKWLIMGVESFSQGGASEVAEKFLLLHRAALNLDESSRIKTHNKIRTKAIIKLGTMATLRYIATGTPFTKGLHQAWAQYEFMDPNILDIGYFAFRNHFCVMGGYKGKQIMGTINEEQFVDLVAPYTFRAKKSEVLKDLPPKVYQIRKVKPTEEQARIYKDLDKEGGADLEGGFVSYTNTLVKQLRLHQVCGGFVAITRPDLEPVTDITSVEEYLQRMADTVECIPIAGNNPKIEELMEITDEIPGKMIVWARYKPEVKLIAEALRKEFGDEAVVEFHGDINNDNRAIARRRFQDDPKCLYFVGQVSTGGIGITLTAASTMVYFGNAWPLEDRIQSEDRFHRIGQVADSCLIIDLVVDANWTDHKIVKAHKLGKDFVEYIMDQVGAVTSGVDHGISFTM